MQQRRQENVAAGVADSTHHGSTMGRSRRASPSKNQQNRANQDGHGAGDHRKAHEREPCNRCIENAKKRGASQLKKKSQPQKANYLPINFDELEA